MVFFCCDGCSETLKKRQVDNHAARCRDCASVSCVDCNVSFFGDDYRTHTTCITEAERYEGKKPKVKLSPQDAWMDLIAESVGKAPGHLQGYISQMVTLSNVPRKAKAFRNFTANSLNLRGKHGDGLVTELWEFLQKTRDEQKEAKENQQEPSTKARPAKPIENEPKAEENERVSPEIPTIEKDTELDAPVEPTAIDSKAPDPKSVKKAMKKVLKKHQSLTVKMLRKHVRVKLGDVSKSQIKELVQTGLTDDKLFKVNGKTIELRMSD